jgi:hypothetical protein
MRTKRSVAGLVLSVNLVVLALLGPGYGACAAPAGANKDRVDMLEKKLDQTLEVVRELSERVRDLESQLARSQGGAPGTAPAVAGSASAVGGQVSSPAAAQGGAAVAEKSNSPDVAKGAVAGLAAPGGQQQTSQRLDVLEQEVNQMAASAARPSESAGMPLHGFADVGAGNHNAQYPQYKLFDIAELDFFLTPQLGPRTRALFELNFEVGEDGSVGVDLERAQIGYQFSEGANLWVGRFHTPFGFYNTAFHHGQEIATSLRRPRFLDFEDHGGVMPAHTVGAWLNGSERMGDGKWTYDVFVGNSQRISGGTVDMNNAGNTTGKPIFGGNVGYLPGGVLDGLKVGLSAFQARSIDNQDVFPDTNTRLTNYGTYAVYDTDEWEGFAELYVFEDQDLSGGTGRHRSDAGFVQWGYRAGRYIPYIRYERAALQQSDPYFAAQLHGQSYYRDALGLRFDIDVKSALKVEFANTQFTDRHRVDFGEALLQYAIRF